ncbi:MAG: PorV/PorQ family protein [Bacteroidales bacterium]|nr:PorV/PorQ family protein [Bacteroidales bacterium]
MKLKIIYLTAIFIAIYFNATGQKYSNEFLNIGAGSRALSMGNSVLASSSDIYSGYWNPSGLLLLSNNINLGVMHSSYFGGLAKYDFGAVAIKNTDSSAFGISVLRFGVDDIPNTLDLVDANGNFDFSKLRSFSVADYAFLFSYARKFNRPTNITWGANVKIIRRIVGEFASAWGFGFDIAAQYKYRSILLGLTLRDATSTFTAWSYNTETFSEAFLNTGNEIPQNGFEITRPRLMAGIAYEYKFNDKFSLLSEINADITFDGKRNTLIKSSFASIDPHTGIEFSYQKKFFIRTGIFNIQKAYNERNSYTLNVQPTIGAGIRHKTFSIDYAFTDIGNASAALYSHVISVSFGLDRK